MTASAMATDENGDPQLLLLQPSKNVPPPHHHYHHHHHPPSSPKKRGSAADLAPFAAPSSPRPDASRVFGSRVTSSPFPEAGGTRTQRESEEQLEADRDPPGWAVVLGGRAGDCGGDGVHGAEQQQQQEKEEEEEKKGAAEGGRFSDESTVEYGRPSDAEDLPPQGRHDDGDKEEKEEERKGTSGRASSANAGPSPAASSTASSSYSPTSLPPPGRRSSAGSSVASGASGSGSGSVVIHPFAFASPELRLRVATGTGGSCAGSLCYSPSPLAVGRELGPRGEEGAAAAGEDREDGTSSSGEAGADLEPDRHQDRDRIPASVAVAVGARPRGPPRQARAGGPRPPRGARAAGSAAAPTTTTSVNPQISRSREARIAHQARLAEEAAALRAERARIKRDALSFQSEAERVRRDALDMQRDLAARLARARSQRERMERMTSLAEVDREVEFKSQVHREHQHNTKKAEDWRRRRSAAVKASIWAERRGNSELMRLEAIEEDAALSEERAEASRALREKLEGDARRRRMSLAFRNAEGRRQREEEEQRAAAKMHDEQKSLALKLEGERSAEEYRRQMAEKRRLSLAFRNAEGRRQREEEEERAAEKMHDEHESHELDAAAERDVAAYRKEMAEKRRLSLAFRNAEGRRQREEEEERAAEKMHDEHESHELDAAAERDVAAYRKEMAEKRRLSLAFRNAEGSRQREQEELMREEEMHERHQSLRLKLAGMRDADEHREQLAKERRQSLEMRNAEGRRQREEEEQRKAEELHAEHESYELKHAADRDVDEYRNRMADERRESFAFRNAEGWKNREKEEQRNDEERLKEHKSYGLKWAGERDAHAYKEQMAKERRDSLSFRNEESKRHNALMEELQDLVQEKEHESYMLKWAGEKDAEAYLADQEEKQRESLRLRNAEGREHRDLEEDERFRKLHEANEDEALKAAGESKRTLKCQHYSGFFPHKRNVSCSTCLLILMTFDSIFYSFQHVVTLKSTRPNALPVTEPLFYSVGRKPEFIGSRRRTRSNGCSISARRITSSKTEHGRMSENIYRNARVADECRWPTAPKRSVATLNGSGNREKRASRSAIAWSKPGPLTALLLH